MLKVLRAEKVNRNVREAIKDRFQLVQLNGPWVKCLIDWRSNDDDTGDTEIASIQVVKFVSQISVANMFRPVNKQAMEHLLSVMQIEREGVHVELKTAGAGLRR